MASHESHEPVGPSEEALIHSISVGHETSDVSVKVIFNWGIGLGVFLIAVAGLMTLLFTVLQQPPFAPAPIRNAMMPTTPMQPPAGMPVLQDNPAGDPRPDSNPRKGVDNIREFRRDEEIKIYDIPLERAMELAVDKLPIQRPGDPPTGVAPTPAMQLKPIKTSPNPSGGTTQASRP